VSRVVQIRSEGETLRADLYGEVPAKRAVVLVHGMGWDADGWRDIAPRFVARGIPALALNLRGHGGSSGTKVALGRFVDGKWHTEEPPSWQSWSPIADVAAAMAMLREHGATEVALVGASLGGHAVLGTSSRADVECVVSISAPVIATPDEAVRRITARKLFVCANEDPAMPHVLRAFEVAQNPKTLLAFGGKEHARGMFAAPYGDEAIEAVVSFVGRGL
jgi:alpha-beta hydrolase superfamily lysophospholipase